MLLVMRPLDIGPVDAMLSPITVRAGRPATFTLMARDWLPPVEQVTQSYGLCFDTNHQVLLVADPSVGWNLPGGTVEPGEELRDTLVREVAEEACARVVEADYLASQHVHDPENPAGRTSYYQSRWWARVELDDWQPRFETTARKLVAPEDIAQEIFWAETAVLSRLMEFALEIELRHP
ncbi:MAG: NUDIX hydrolase [Acidimicrobiales bacterium]